MPAAHQRSDRTRLRKAEPGKSAQSLRIVLDPGEDEVAGAGKCRSLFEELRIVPLDRNEMPQQIGDKRVRLRESEKNPDARDPGTVSWKCMRLRIIDHLQAMLETAEEPIVIDQLSAGRRINPAGRAEATQRFAGRTGPQFAQAPAPDQLLGLREEFDFADTAATGLDVVALNSDSPTPAIGVDLALDRMDVLDRSKIEVFSPDKWVQLAQKVLPGDSIAGYRTSFDQRCPFPILADALIVGECGGDR